MSKNLTFSCGCSFRITDQDHIEFNPSVIDINLDCSKTWDLISSGNTKGCFQLESRLGRSMAKKLKPENIEQLAALISIMRPGCLEAYRDGKSVSSHYIDKKNCLESVNYFHQSLEPTLKNTYGEMVYQEQAMEITRTIAGFDLQEADMLRKAIGKKKPEEMAKVKSKFIEGSKIKGIVNESEAEEIFGWIEKSQRYSFNKSHAVSYAMNAYLSAYTKAHFPRVFFASYLRFAKDKIDPQQEIKELIQNANEMDILVKTPDIRLLNQYFILKDKTIYFGLTDIKSVGESVYKKIISIIEENQIDLNSSWPNCLFRLLSNINSTSAKSLISCGAMDYTGISRNKMLFDLGLALKLTDREKNIIIAEILQNNITCMKELFKILLHNGKLIKKRLEDIQESINLLNNPPFSLQDSPEWISDQEDMLLGCPITCSKIDMYDISMTNCNCKDIKNRNYLNDNLTLAVEIDRINTVKTKKGKNAGSNMAFLSVNDGSGSLDSVVLFPEQYAKYKQVLYEGNIIVLKGKSNKKDDSFVVEKVFLPSS
jgi:DNA polymerase-3 subunit alpha